MRLTVAVETKRAVAAPITPHRGINRTLVPRETATHTKEFTTFILLNLAMSMMAPQMPVDALASSANAMMTSADAPVTKLLPKRARRCSGTRTTTNTVADIVHLVVVAYREAISSISSRSCSSARTGRADLLIDKFLATFMGALIFTGLSALLHLQEEVRSVLPWIVVAAVLYFATVVITLTVNVPLNDAIKAAGDPDRITDLAEVRDEFDETRWTRWNRIRVLTTTPAFGCLAWALVLLGRAT